VEVTHKEKERFEFLERRRNFLAKRIADGDRNNEINWMLHEKSALEWAMEIIKEKFAKETEGK
jgi:hypothetical protein